jgi:hypothetical protein
MKKTNDHYFPAGLIGGFGVVPSTGRHAGQRRHAKVAARFADKPDEVVLPKAERIARENGSYTLETPPAGLLRNVIDSLWDSYEPKLPGSIRAMELDRNTDRD